VGTRCVGKIDHRAKLTEEPFSFRRTKAGDIFISWNGKTVTTLKGKTAATFLAKIDGVNNQDAQLLMAKATGHFKHGTERSSKPKRG
jgi:hypothetical protein